MIPCPARHLVFACALVLAGCTSTPRQVNDLAGRTAANAGILGAELERLSRESAELAALRAQTISRLHAANAELRAQYNFDVALTRKAGQAADLELIDEVRRWHAEAEELYRGVDEAGAVRKAEILSQIATLDAKAGALKEVGDRLAKIAELDSPEDRARFIAGFAKQVRQDVKSQLDKDDPSAKQAKALLLKVKE